MARDSEAQQVLEQLTQARHEALMWSTPFVQPTQTPDLLTGGMTGQGSHAGGVNLAAIQAQQALEMQSAIQQQLYLRSYAQGTPGVMSPVQSMANPLAANYQLQNMYMMNPYMANFFGTTAGAPNMNLAPAAMMTPPSMGIFRGGQRGHQGMATGFGGWARDLATLAELRSFAPYEDPIDEVIGATQRQTRRKENWAIGGISAGAAAASFAVGGPLGLAIGFGLEPAVDMASSAYYQRRAETEQIYDISKRIATGSNATGNRSRGFSLQESNKLMKSFRKEAAESPFYNMADYMQVLDVGSQSGLYNFSGSSGATERKTKELISMVDMFMRVAGDPDVQSAMHRMGTLQTMGLSTGQMKGAITNLRAAANQAGTSVDQIMATSGAYGAQMATSMGGPASFGMMIGAHAQAISESIAQRGVYDPLQLSLRGGKEGLTQSLTQEMTNHIYTMMATNTAAFTKMTSDGHFVIDEKAKSKFFASGEVPGGAASIDQASLNNLGKFRERMPEFLAQQKDLAGQLVNGMSNLDHIMAIKNDIARFRKINPSVITEDMAYQTNFGDNWRAIKEMTSAEGIGDMLAQQQEAIRTGASGARNKFIRANSLFNRVGTGISSLFNSVVNTIMPFDWMANYEQEKTMQAEGKLFLPGLNYGLAASVHTGGLEKMGYGAKSYGMIDNLPGPTQVIDPSKAFEKLRDDDKFIKYMRTTEGISGVTWAGKHVDQVAGLSKIAALQQYGNIIGSTSGPENSISPDDLAKYKADLFHGTGTDSVFDVQKFNSLDLSAATKSRMIKDFEESKDGNVAYALDEARGALKQVMGTTAEYRADVQKTLLDDIHASKITDDQFNNISDFANTLAGKVGKMKQGEFSNLEQDLLRAGNTLNKGEKGSKLYKDILGKYGVKISEQDTAALYDKYKQINKQAEHDKMDFGSFVLSNTGWQTLGKINEASVEGAKALEESNRIDRVAPPSSFSDAHEVQSYANAQTTAMLRQNYEDLAAKNKVDDKTYDQYYGKGGKGEAYKDRAEKEGLAFSSSVQNTSNSNLDTNPQLSEKQNLRQMAAALTNIEVTLTALSRKASEKFFTG